MAYDLDQEIAHYSRRGFTVLSRTETSASLHKPKRFHFALFVLGLLAFGVPGLLYLAWYLAQRDESLYLSVDASGRVQRHGGKWTLGSWMARRVQGRA